MSKLIADTIESNSGTITVNGPILNSGSANLMYPYDTRSISTVIPVPSWATTIEIDFYAFKCANSSTYYSLIRVPLTVSTNAQTTSDFRMSYQPITTSQGYSANSGSSGRWGSAAGASSGQVMYLLTNSGGNNFEYNGTLKIQKVPFLNGSNGATNNIYYVDLTANYTRSGSLGSLWYNGWMYGAGGNPNDVLREVTFSSNSPNDNHFGQFNARFRQEDPGTIVTQYK